MKNAEITAENDEQKHFPGMHINREINRKNIIIIINNIKNLNIPSDKMKLNLLQALAKYFHEIFNMENDLLPFIKWSSWCLLLENKELHIERCSEINKNVITQMLKTFLPYEVYKNQEIFEGKLNSNIL